eukprot:2265144-Rhodomonas_salina.1
MLPENGQWEIGILPPLLAASAHLQLESVVCLRGTRDGTPRMTPSHCHAASITRSGLVNKSKRRWEQGEPLCVPDHWQLGALRVHSPTRRNGSGGLHHWPSRDASHVIMIT